MDSQMILPVDTKGDLVEINSSIAKITGGNRAVNGPGVYIEFLQAGASQSGYLSSSDWNTFNGKQPAGNYITALTGDVTASGPGSVAATIAAGAVTLAKMANLAANALIGNNTGSPATPLALSASQVKTLLAITESDVANLTTDLAAKVPTSRTINGYDLSADRSLTYADVGAAPSLHSHSHSGLSNLDADDHPQYAPADGSRPFTAPTLIGSSYGGIIELLRLHNPAVGTGYGARLTFASEATYILGHPVAVACIDGICTETVHGDGTLIIQVANYGTLAEVARANKDGNFMFNTTTPVSGAKITVNGTLAFGTYTGTVRSITGYITVYDSAGTAHKLACVD